MSSQHGRVVRVLAGMLMAAGISLTAFAERPWPAREPRIRLSKAEQPGAGEVAPLGTPRAHFGSDPGRVASPTCWVESNAVAFGSVLPGQPAFSEGAVQVRVVSPGPFTLKLEASSPLRTTAGEVIPAERLSWRSRRSGGFMAVPGVGPVVVGEGGATSAAGTVVVLDLRLDLQDRDPLGAYVVPLRVFVEQQ